MSEAENVISLSWNIGYLKRNFAAMKKFQKKEKKERPDISITVSIGRSHCWGKGAECPIFSPIKIFISKGHSERTSFLLSDFSPLSLPNYVSYFKISFFLYIYSWRLDKCNICGKRCLCLSMSEYYLGTEHLRNLKFGHKSLKVYLWICVWFSTVCHCFVWLHKKRRLLKNKLHSDPIKVM